DAAATPLARVLAAMAAVLGRDPAQLAPDDDFFAVGGNSLRAAMLVSRLRRWPELASVAVRDVYATPDAAGLAAALAARAPAVGHRDPRRPAPPPVLAFPVVPLSVLACSLFTVAALAYGLAFGVLPWLFANWSLPTLLLLAPWLAVGARLLFAAGSYWLLLVA